MIFRMLENKIDRDEAVQRLVGLLIGPGPLCIELTEAGRERLPEVQQQLAARIEEQFGLTVTVEEATVQPDTAEQIAPAFEGDEFGEPGVDDPYPRRPRDLTIVAQGLGPHSSLFEPVRELCLSLEDAGRPLVADCFFDPGEPVAVSIKLTPEGDAQGWRDAQADSPGGLRLRGVRGCPAHGRDPVGRNELNREAVASIWNPRYPAWNFYKRSPVILSVCVSVLFAFVVLHSVRLAVLVLVTSLYAALIATALVPITGTALNMVLVVMPNLLFVLTTSGAIHVANYWQHAAQEQEEGAIDRAVRLALQPCGLASITTAIGLASLGTSLLLPVRQFGMFSAIGCVLSLVMVLVVFPALMLLWSGKPLELHQVDRSRWEALGRWLSRHSMVVTLACLALFLGAGWGLRYFETQTKVIRYFRPSLRIVQDYEFLENRLSGILPLEVVVAFPETIVSTTNSVERLEIVRQVQDRLIDNPEISGLLSLADFRPRLDPPSPNAPLPVKARYNRTIRGLDEYLAASNRESKESFVLKARDPIQFPQGDQVVTIATGEELWRIRARRRCSLTPITVPCATK